MIERFEQLSYYIYSIYRTVQKIEKEEMKKHGLRGAYAQYLVAMARYPQGLTSARLCELCDKDKAAASRCVSEMEEKGLIARESGNFSMYRAKLTLTEKGKEIAAFVLKKVTTAVELAGVGLDEESRRIFYASLGLIESNLKKICQNGIPD